MISILGDLIADFSLRIPEFPVQAGDMTHVKYMELGPGGATNVAIMLRHFGEQVACLGETGDDEFGEIVREGLQTEGVDISGVVVSEGSETPVAGVVVDKAGEPAYLGYRGDLAVKALTPEWRTNIQSSVALFADGWADHDAVPEINLEGLKAAREAGVRTFFDPGPGNREYDLEWHLEALKHVDVLLATEAEANRLTGLADPLNAALALLDHGPELIVVKRGVAGCVLFTRGQVQIAPGFPVEARDATGAGDSLDAAVIHGCLREMDLESLGTLANATGAAKVQKLGTGHNMPALEEVRAVLERYGRDGEGLLD
ncbi:MAG: carbohydrate kinase family protein [Anaerolineales bacterium]|nr:carbohydrate kinase family protein [Anaerolineales bacterium]